MQDSQESTSVRMQWSSVASSSEERSPTHHLRVYTSHRWCFAWLKMEQAPSIHKAYFLSSPLPPRVLYQIIFEIFWPLRTWRALHTRSPTAAALLRPQRIMTLSSTQLFLPGQTTFPQKHQAKASVQNIRIFYNITDRGAVHQEECLRLVCESLNSVLQSTVVPETGSQLRTKFNLWICSAKYGKCAAERSALRRVLAKNPNSEYVASLQWFLLLQKRSWQRLVRVQIRHCSIPHLEVFLQKITCRTASTFHNVLYQSRFLRVCSALESSVQPWPCQKIQCSGLARPAQLYKISSTGILSITQICAPVGPLKFLHCRSPPSW